MLVKLKEKFKKNKKIPIKSVNYNGENGLIFSQPYCMGCWDVFFVKNNGIIPKWIQQYELSFGQFDDQDSNELFQFDKNINEEKKVISNEDGSFSLEDNQLLIIGVLACVAAPLAIL